MPLPTTRLAASLAITLLPAVLQASGQGQAMNLAPAGEAAFAVLAAGPGPQAGPGAGEAAAPALAPPAAVPAGMSLHQRLGFHTAVKLAAIAADNEDRLRRCKADGKALDVGVFYPNEYALALQANLEAPRFNYFRDRGALYHGFAPREFFEPVPDPRSASGYGAMDFRLRPGKSPAAAIRSFGARLALMDCGSSACLACYDALLGVLGDAKFHILFGSQAPVPLRVNFLQKGNPILPLVRLVPDQEPMAVGQIASFDGIPDYPLKHLNGEAGRFNVIISETGDPGRERYVGLGLPSRGVDHRGLVQVFLDEYNARPVGWEIFTEQLAEAIQATYPPIYLQVVAGMADHTLDLAGFHQRGGIRLFQRHEFRAERVQALIDATPEQGLELLAAWWKENPGLR